MTPAELCAMATKLAEERTDGSTAALYLLVERMRPVMVTLVAEVTGLQKRQAELLAEVGTARSERDDLRRELDWWENRFNNPEGAQ